MPNSEQRARLVISVDVDPIGLTRPVDSRPIAAVVDHVAERIGRLDLAATWATTFAAEANGDRAAVRSCRAGMAELGEVAMLAAPDWAGADASRRRFAEELSARRLRGRACGATITTLALRRGTPTAHLDLAFKHGITAIAGARAHGARPAKSAPQQRRPRRIRFGLTLVPTAIAWPADGGRFAIRPTAGFGRLLDLAAHHGGVVQLAVDAADLAALRGRALGSLDRMLALAARRRDEGRVEVVTVAEAARQTSPARVGQPACSILRRAA